MVFAVLALGIQPAHHDVKLARRGTKVKGSAGGIGPLREAASIGLLRRAAETGIIPG